MIEKQQALKRIREIKKWIKYSITVGDLRNYIDEACKLYLSIETSKTKKEGVVLDKQMATSYFTQNRGSFAEKKNQCEMFLSRLIIRLEELE